jgi:hypothetical protein
LAVLVDDRHRAIARDFAYARSIRLRRSIAVAVYALGAGFTALGAVLDDEPGTVRA